MNNNYVMLNNVDHQGVRVITERSARLGDDVNYAMTFPMEFRQAQSCYPIFLRKDNETGKFFPIVLFGFEQQENLFLQDENWDAPYIPIMIRRHPFLIGFQQSQDQGGEKQSVVSIDMNSPRVSESEGEALFLEHGGSSEFLVSMTKLLETIQFGHELNTEFIDALVEFDLVESVSMAVTLDDQSKHQLLGYYTINEEKLLKLDGDALAKLHSGRHLESIYMILASLSCFRDLIEKKNQQLESARPQ